MSVQDLWYWEFNALQGRFQEYAPDYISGGKTKTAELDLSTITAPDIAMFATTIDVNCPLNTAKSMKDQIGGAVKKFYEIDNTTHMNHYFGSANDYNFMQQLMDQLTKDNAITRASIALTGLVMSAAMLA